MKTYRVISETGLVRQTGRTLAEAKAYAASIGGKVVADEAETAPPVPRTGTGPRYPESDCDRSVSP